MNGFVNRLIIDLMNGAVNEYVIGNRTWDSERHDRRGTEPKGYPNKFICDKSVNVFAIDLFLYPDSILYLKQIRIQMRYRNIQHPS